MVEGLGPEFPAEVAVEMPTLKASRKATSVLSCHGLRAGPLCGPIEKFSESAPSAIAWLTAAVEALVAQPAPGTQSLSAIILAVGAIPEMTTDAPP